jgi:diacylglycerol kinase family enzyme
MARGLHLLVNRHAGAFTGALTVEEVVGGLESAGWSPVTVTDLTDDIEAGIKKAACESHDCVAIAAGDGTVAALATAFAAMDNPPPLLVLPAGTANLVARRLCGEADMATVIAASGEWAPRRIPVGRVEGRVFLIAAAVGITPSFARARELLRQPARDGRMAAVWRHLQVGMRSLSTRYIGFLVDEETRYRPAKAAYISVGRMGDAHARDGESVFAPLLEIYAGRPYGVIDMSVMVARAAFNDFENQPRAWRATARRIEANAKRRIPLIIDGEPVEAHSPVVFELIEDGLCVMSPKV